MSALLVTGELHRCTCLVGYPLKHGYVRQHTRFLADTALKNKFERLMPQSHLLQSPEDLQEFDRYFYISGTHLWSGHVMLQRLRMFDGFLKEASSSP